MANIRQYIGARYVFKIYENSQDPSSAEWEANVTYEPLTIVTYLNSTYASKKDVPGSVGNPAANPQYWIVTGAYNGQIATLQQQIAAINAAINTINNTTIPAIDSRLDALETGKTRKFIFVSDSYGARTYDNKTLIECICEFAGIDAADYNNVQLNGSGFIGLTTSQPFLTMLQNATITIPADEVTDIIVIGGANDITETQSDVEAAIKDFCYYCKSTYENATVRLAHAGRCWDKARHTTVATISLPAWRNCAAFGAVYIPNSEYILHKKSLVESDNVHPTSAGVFEIARQLTLAILTGECDVHYRTTASIDVNNGTLFTSVTKAGSSPITITVDNDITVVSFGAENRIVAQMAAAQAFGTDIAINDIATLNQTDDCALFGNLVSGSSQGIPIVACPLDGTNGTPVEAIPGIMYIGSANNILFNLQNRFISDYQTHTYIGAQLYVQNQSYTVPSELC